MQYAEFIAAHAVGMLFAATLALLMLTAAFWWLIHRYGGVVWRVSGSVGRAAARSAPATYLRRFAFASAAVARFVGAVRQLGLQALVSFAVAVLAFGAFVGIADEIGVDEDLARFDEALSRSLHEHVSRDVLRAFAVITRLGDAGFLIPLAIFVAILLAWRRSWTMAAAWALATALGGSLNGVLKALFERTRPVHDHGLIEAVGWSFPSGHASGSMLVYGLLGYVIVRNTPAVWHIPVALVSATLIVFVGFSRVILQVHYFSDVIAGYAAAAAWLAMWIAGLEAARWRSVNRARANGLSG